MNPTRPGRVARRLSLAAAGVVMVAASTAAFPAPASGIGGSRSIGADLVGQIPDAAQLACDAADCVFDHAGAQLLSLV